MSVKRQLGRAGIAINNVVRSQREMGISFGYKLDEELCELSELHRQNRESEMLKIIKRSLFKRDKICGTSRQLMRFGGCSEEYTKTASNKIKSLISLENELRNTDRSSPLFYDPNLNHFEKMLKRIEDV